MKNKTKQDYEFNDSMIIDKIQDILKGKNIDEIELTDEELGHIKNILGENLSFEEVQDCAYLVAENIDELNILPDEQIKEYIYRLKAYLINTTFNSIKAEFKGVDFVVSRDSSIDDVFKEYYAKYDSLYGISDMLIDLGLKDKL